MTLDLKKLTMIMRMTESGSDGEALNAVRLANRMLAADGKHWGDVLVGSAHPTRTAPDWRTPPSKRKRGAGDTTRYGRAASQRREQDERRVSSSDIDVMLAELGSRRHDMSTMMFIASLNDWWERNGYLTGPQYDALKSMNAGRGL